MKNSENMLFFLVRETWRYAEHWRRWMALFYALFFFSVLFIAFQPMVLATIINTVQDNSPDAVNKALFWAAVYGALTIGFWTLHGPGRVIERRLGYIVFHNFVSDLYGKVTEMPLRWHQDHHSGDTINRVNKAGRSLFNFAQEQFVIIQMSVRFTTAI